MINRKKDRGVPDEKTQVGALYDQYVPRLLSICIRYTGNREDAEDVLHDGFIKIIKGIGQFKVRNEHSLQAWMKKIIVNTALNHLRDHKKEKFFLSVEDDQPILQIADEESEEPFHGLTISKDELMNLVCELPTGYRTVFNLYVMEGYPHKKIATLLGCSENTSKSQLSKARSFLRKQLELYREHALSSH